MPALIGLSPRLADHSFPRDDFELRLVAQALGRLSEFVDNQTVHILRTEFYRMLLSDFHWENAGSIKNQIYTHLNLWLLQGRVVAQIQADTTGRQYKPHPIPQGSRTQDRLEDVWADELGKIVVMHDDNVYGNEYFIGIACEKAFAGQPIGAYENHTCTRFFPLVGPDSCDCNRVDPTLADAYERQVPQGYTQTEVSFEAAKRHAHVIGATEVRKPKRGSHYKVKFQDARSWTLDSNHDPVLESHLKELVDITGLSFEVIAYALREGQLPPLRLRLSEV